MKTAYFRFYAELNDFFPAAEDGQVHKHQFKGVQSVKDRIESMGVPHTEVYFLLANGEPIDFSYHVQDGDQISVYPYFKSLSLPSDWALREPYTGEAKFVLDNHLGKLARYLRMLGFDVWYNNDYQDPELAEISADTGRILLTRDRGLLQRSKVTYGYFIRSEQPRRQLLAVLDRYNLFAKIESFGRCIACNGQLVPIAKDKIIHRLEPKTKKYYHEFYICSDCEKIYWPGSHYQDMKEFIEKIKQKAVDV